MMRGFMRFVGRESGSAAIEFAVYFPVLLAVSFGVVAYSETFIAGQQVNWAAGELARSMAFGESESDRATLFANGMDDILEVFLFPDCATAVMDETGGRVAVTVTYAMKGEENSTCSIFPFADFLPRPDRLLATFTMAVE